MLDVEEHDRSLGEPFARGAREIASRCVDRALGGVDERRRTSGAGCRDGRRRLRAMRRAAFPGLLDFFDGAVFVAFAAVRGERSPPGLLSDVDHGESPTSVHETSARTRPRTVFMTGALEIVADPLVLARLLPRSIALSPG